MNLSMSLRRTARYLPHHPAISFDGAPLTYGLLEESVGRIAAGLADVKIGVVQGLSGPPAIVDFGESLWQFNDLAGMFHPAGAALLAWASCALVMQHEPAAPCVFH